MSSGRGRRVLVRDLEQLVSPAGRDAPLRGAALGEVERLDDAYALCEDGRVAAVGKMRDLKPLEGEVEELDGRGRCAIPGLVDCHTHACFAGDRVGEFALRASGASYEELHAAGGGILATVRATRAAGERALGEIVARHRSWMLRAGTTTFEGKSGYGLDRDTELASLRAIRNAGGLPTWLGAHAVPPEFDDADAYLAFALREVLPEAAPLAEAADVFLERGAFDAGQARRYLEACRKEGLTLRLHGDQFTEAGAIPLALELGARSVDHLEATGDEGVRALAASDVVGVLLPASALFLGRPMPRARALVDAGAAVALATDFNPGSAFCESLPLVCSLACTQLRLSPAEALAAVTVNAAHVLGRGDRVGRIAPGYDADLVLLDAPDWRYLAYHLAGQVVAEVVKAGETVVYSDSAALL
ncbi:MAG TPA: imidazolonepropionase [Gaiellaceae bacterium]|jgi:imidazolonepropionase|nr:imidazolonepropionase [Gaiellaceae bacterium]